MGKPGMRSGCSRFYGWSRRSELVRLVSNVARELRIDEWCDVCLADGQHEPGETVEVSLGGRAPRVLELCERDRKTYLAPLAELLETFGRKPDAPAHAPRRARADKAPAEERPGAVLLGVGPEEYPFTCPICHSPRPSGQALSAHMKARHAGVGIAEFYGLRCPVCGDEMNAYSGLGMHLTKTHGVTGGVAVGFEWARVNGDPAGVVAERLALML